MDNIFFDKKDLKHCGENVIIGKTVRIRRPELVSIGDHVIIDDFTYISCGMNIGPFSHIAPNCTFSGGAGFVNIGAFVGISASSSVITGSSNYRVGCLDLPTIPDNYVAGAIVKEILISDFCLLGASSVVLPGVVMPQGMTTGALTLVRKKDYEKWGLYVGNPVRKLGIKDSKKMIEDSKNLLEDYHISYTIF